MLVMLFRYMDPQPGVADAIYQSKSQAVIQHEIWRVARAIQRAASALKGQLT